jgi:putative transposase
MPEYRRSQIAGGTYFFTVVTRRRRPVLTETYARSALRAAIQQARKTLPFVIEAWVLMPDHLHCIWTLPHGDTNYAARWAIIKRHASRAMASNETALTEGSRQKRGEYGFWQRRFWEHLIRDEEDLRRHLDYIHWNPVKHGCARTVAVWPYSSFHRYVRDGVYAADWGGVGAILEGEFGE